MKSNLVRGPRRGPLDRVDTTPNLRARRPGSIWPALLLTLLLPIGALLALIAFGQPALRIEYDYQGTWERPVFERCLYLLLDGSWRELHLPFPQTDVCPFIHTFPFTPFKEA